MKSETLIRCSKCQKPIVSGAEFVCFKIPGKESYRYFHCRFRGEDCWDAYLKEGQSA